MSDTVIKVENLGKKYIINHETGTGGYKRFSEEIVNFFKKTGKAAIGRNTKLSAKEEFWALKGVSFDVKQGDRIGIIGRNGAGKSTLLKLLSRITEPSSGRISLNGRVASLLEVGTGFHPELTGRENIYLNGAILGMGKSEIKRKFDEIVDFSGVEKFLDTPVKRYSSGMYVRLAFSVAAHLEPEILVVDEVLAVGDADFQKKCLGKMEDVSKSEGRTLLFVSHSMASITSLCNRCIYLSEGKVCADSTPSDAILKYYSSNLLNTPYHMNYKDFPKKIGDDVVILLEGSIEKLNGEKTSEIEIHDAFCIKMKYQILLEANQLIVPNFHFYNEGGICVFVSGARDVKQMTTGIYEAICHIPDNLMNEGTYFVGLAMTSYMPTGCKVNFFELNALSFNVKDPMDFRSARYGYTGPIPGVVRPILDWEIVKVNE